MPATTPPIVVDSLRAATRVISAVCGTLLTDSNLEFISQRPGGRHHKIWGGGGAMVLSRAVRRPARAAHDSMGKTFGSAAVENGVLPRRLPAVSPRFPIRPSKRRLNWLGSVKIYDGAPSAASRAAAAAAATVAAQNPGLSESHTRAAGASPLADHVHERGRAAAGVCVQRPRGAVRALIPPLREPPLHTVAP